MECQTWVLKQRVEVLTIKRGHLKPQKRVRGKDDKGVERDRNRRLNRQNPCLERIGKVAAKPARTGAKQGQDQQPQEHRPLVVAPNARHFVEHRFVAVRVHRDQFQRKVRGDKRIGQGRKTKPHKDQLRGGRGVRDRHPVTPALLGADHRDHHLDDSDAKAQNQGKVSEFSNHAIFLTYSGGLPNHNGAIGRRLC